MVGWKHRVLKVTTQEGQRLMIIKLERYNKIRELLIENGTTGLWGHIHYQDGGWSASVTMMAVHTGKKEMGMSIGHRGTYNWSLSRE